LAQHDDEEELLGSGPPPELLLSGGWQMLKMSVVGDQLQVSGSNWL
jgi:hypothetical protein